MLVQRAPLDRAAQVYVPKSLRMEILTVKHAPAHAGHPGANKMYVSMRRFIYWESMVADMYAYVANCGTCAKGRVGGRRRTNPLMLFPPTEPLSVVCLDLLGPLPKTAMGNWYLLVMVDRFPQLTRVVAIPREDAETVASAFCDTWVASYGPPDTLLTDNGPQLTSTLFQGVCRLMGITNVYSTTYHPQSQGQVERCNRTIVAQLKAYVEDHQDTWDELVSVLTLAYNSRPQRSTGVSPFEFVVPERVRTLALERLPKNQYPETVPRTAREARERQRGHLRNLITQVRAALATAQRRYKRNFDKWVRPVNKALNIGDWVFVDAHDTNRRKLDHKAVGPFEIVRTDGHTYTVLVDALPATVSSDHVTWAPPPTEQEPNVYGWTVPDAVVPDGHGPDIPAFVWDRFLNHEVDDDGDLWLKVRWWGYGPEEDTWERARKFDPPRSASMAGASAFQTRLDWRPSCVGDPTEAAAAKSQSGLFVPKIGHLRLIRRASPCGPSVCLPWPAGGGWTRSIPCRTARIGSEHAGLVTDKRLSRDRRNGRNGRPIHVTGLSRLQTFGSRDFAQS